MHSLSLDLINPYLTLLFLSLFPLVRVSFYASHFVSFHFINRFRHTAISDI